MKLNLSHKGLILVSGVLLFELMLVAVFAGLLQRAEQDVSKSSLSTSVIAHLDKVRQLFMDVELHSADSDSTRYKEATEMLPYEFHALRTLLKDDGRALSLVGRAESTVNDELRRLHQERAGTRPRDAAQSMAAFREANEMLSSQIEQIAVDYQKRPEFIPDAETLSRHLTEKSLLVLLLLNAMVAVANTLFFIQSITRRLGVLMDNSLRFAKGKPLNLPLPGSDEITQLDRTFHETIRERILVENLLKESEARTRSLIENLPVGIVTLNQQGEIESINPRIEQIFGYSYEELADDHFLSLFSHTHETDPAEFMTKIQEEAFGKTAEFECRRKNGEIFPIEMSLHEVFTAEGQSMMANIQDITERRRTEQLKQELIAMVSHDLRSPLTSVQGVMTLLAQGHYGQLTETGYNRVKVAEKGLGRLIALVDDILDLEKMEAGKLQFNFDIRSLSSIIDRSIDSVHDFANASGVNIVAPITEFDIYCDDDRLVQVLVNLLSNAVKFSPAGSTVSIETRQLEDRLEVSVTDQGPGIASADIGGLFQRFHQLETADGRTQKGTGLGLAICKAIVEGHNGAIGAVSEVGKGSTFFFRLPYQSHKLRKVANSPEPVKGAQ